jgi:hypothetical protein
MCAPHNYPAAAVDLDQSRDAGYFTAAQPEGVRRIRTQAELARPDGVDGAGSGTRHNADLQGRIGVRMDALLRGMISSGSIASRTSATSESPQRGTSRRSI